MGEGIFTEYSVYHIWTLPFMHIHDISVKGLNCFPCFGGYLTGSNLAFGRLHESLVEFSISHRKKQLILDPNPDLSEPQTHVSFTTQ